MVSADLDLRVTAPDGSAARVRVSDRAGEVVVDVEHPLAALKSLPAAADLRALVRGGRPPRAGVGSAWAELPPIRFRTSGLTVAVARRGRVRPGVAVALPVALAMAVVTTLVIAVSRRGRTAGRRQ